MKAFLFSPRWALGLLVATAFACAGNRDRALAQNAPEPGADPHQRVTVRSASEPQRSALAESGKGDTLRLLQPTNDCDQTVCSGDASDALVAAIRERAAEARGCYESALKETTTLAGRVVIALRVAHDGRGCPLHFEHSEISDSKALVACLRTLLESNYPKPPKGCVDFELPLKFVPEYIESDAGAPAPPVKSH